MTDLETIEAAKPAPEHPVFVKPAWGLTAHIPEGVTLAWGARAIYSLSSVTKPVGNRRTSRPGRARLTTTVYEPSIDLLWDRMGWSSFGAPSDDYKAASNALAAWINTKALAKLRALCGKQCITTDCEDVVEWTDGDYTIKASPNGSYGYLYIAAWKAVSWKAVS